jgi:hypothetical protein
MTPSTVSRRVAAELQEDYLRSHVKVARKRVMGLARTADRMDKPALRHLALDFVSKLDAEAEREGLT